ncbi:MAG: galactose mutarotase [Treponema sp.]|jgi:aldose 1-epimerase|nr:galactose mutarotase [Treponema sp.]
MKINKKTFGILSNGKKVYLYTLKAGDLRLSISSFGAVWTSLLLPAGRNARKNDILLGYSGFDSYSRNTPFFGATVGRFANRIGGARFGLNGQEYRLFQNNGPNCLHGGRRGFDKLLWRAESYEEADGVFVRFEMKSPDGDEGFPGKLYATVSYGLTKSNEVIANYEARAEAPTPMNITNHAYFNLAGEGEGDILSHEVKIYASSYVEVDRALIPTGRLIPVQSTPFDFRTGKTIGADIMEAGRDGPGGYDHCFMLDGEPGKLRPCAEVYEGKTGRKMKLFTTQPGVQFYTGNNLKSVAGKPGSVYEKHAGFCLETQHIPDSPNRPEFPSCIFGPGKGYHEKAVFAFDW